MSVAKAIRRAVPILAEHGSSDPSILVIWLIRAGLSREEAHDAVRFIPLAFGRQILSGMGVSLEDSYVRVSTSDGAREEKALAGEAFFREALTAAPILAAELGGEVFTKVAMLSSEFQAVNQALHAGASPEYLVASPPQVEWSRPAGELPSRPWWKFWA
jgi:hypothetical protein